MLIVAVSCPRVTPSEGLDRRAVSISVPSTVVSVLLVNVTNCSASPGWKVTTWLTGMKSDNPKVWKRSIVGTRYIAAWYAAEGTTGLLQTLATHSIHTHNNSLNYHLQFPPQ